MLVSLEVTVGPGTPKVALPRARSPTAIRAGRDLTGEGAAEDLPGQQRLRDQAEHDVDVLAAQVVGPSTPGAVLQPLVEREDVEEHDRATPRSRRRSRAGARPTGTLLNQRHPGARASTLGSPTLQRGCCTNG